MCACVCMCIYVYTCVWFEPDAYFCCADFLYTYIYAQMWPNVSLCLNFSPLFLLWSFYITASLLVTLHFVTPYSWCLCNFSVVFFTQWVIIIILFVSLEQTLKCINNNKWGNMTLFMFWCLYEPCYLYSNLNINFSPWDLFIFLQ